MVVAHDLTAVLAVGVVVVHVLRERSRSIERVERRDVVETGRREATHELTHLVALELEDPDRVAEAQHLEDLRVVERHVVDVHLDAVTASDVLQGPLDDREVAQSQEVHLQQAELLDGGRLVLRDDRRVLGRTGRTGLALHRHVVEQRVLRDDDRGRVDAVLTALVDEAHRDVDGVLDLGVALVERAKFGRLDVAALVARRRLEAGLERQVLTHHERRHRLGDLVAELRRVAEDTRRVAHRGARLDGRERHDLGDVVRAVAFGGVADHVAAVALVEVHVDVGHGATPRVQEPFEDQAVAQRVDVHDAQAVRDAAPGRRPRPGPTRMPVSVRSHSRLSRPHAPILRLRFNASDRAQQDSLGSQTPAGKAKP